MTRARHPARQPCLPHEVGVPSSNGSEINRLSGHGLEGAASSRAPDVATPYAPDLGRLRGTPHVGPGLEEFSDGVRVRAVPPFRGETIGRQRRRTWAIGSRPLARSYPAVIGPEELSAQAEQQHRRRRERYCCECGRVGLGFVPGSNGARRELCWLHPNFPHPLTSPEESQ